MNKSALFRLEGGGNIIFIGLFELFFFLFSDVVVGSLSQGPEANIIVVH